MPAGTVSEDHFSKIRSLFDRGVCARGMKPLKDGIEIALIIDDKGPITLTKQGGKPSIVGKTPYSADLTFWIPAKALDELLSQSTEDVGEIGVAILKLMAHTDPEIKIRCKVHVGLFEFLRSGYLGVLPLGGTTVMKYLASRGFDGIGKIREAISKLRN